MMVQLARSLRSLPSGVCVHDPTHTHTPSLAGDVRGIGELLLLPQVPSLRLADGKAPQLAVRVPEAPLPRAARDADVCTYLGRLWASTRLALDGAQDKRAHSLGKGHGSLRKVALEFWQACTDHEVAPARWLAWSLAWWRRDKSGQPPLRLMLSGAQVRKGRVRRMFRLNAPRLGGDVFYDPVGRQLLHRHAEMTRALDQLVAATEGHATDAQVEAVVLSVFPKGQANFNDVLMQVHERCSQERARLLGEVERGEYIWAQPQAAAQ